MRKTCLDCSFFSSIDQLTSYCCCQECHYQVCLYHVLLWYKHLHIQFSSCKWLFKKKNQLNGLHCFSVIFPQQHTSLTQVLSLYLPTSSILRVSKLNPHVCGNSGCLVHQSLHKLSQRYITGMLLYYLWFLRKRKYCLKLREERKVIVPYHSKNHTWNVLISVP